MGLHDRKKVSIKKNLPFLGLPIGIIYMELILRAICCGRFWGVGLFMMPLYSLVCGVFITMICCLFRVRRGILITVQSLLSVWYCTQIIYHRFFGKFLILFSLQAGGTDQVLEDGIVQTTLLTILSHWWVILLMALPVVGLCLMTKFYEIPRLFGARGGIAVLCAVAAYALLVGIGYLLPGVRDVQKGAFNTVSDVRTFGLLRTELMDVRCNVLKIGGEGKLEPEETPTVGQKTETEPVVYQKNISDIDFAALAETHDKNAAVLDRYFAEAAATDQNEYTGRFKGYNLIQITAEGFSPYAIDPVLTPTLYKMQTQGMNFTNFYTPIWEVSTSDGEYAATTGLIPKSGVWSYYFSGQQQTLFPYSMPQQFLNAGVENVYAYHNHTYSYYHRDLSHPNLGFIYKGLGNGLTVKKSWPESDLEMIEATADEYISKDRFMSYYMTVSGHLEYSFSDNAMAAKNRAAVENLSCSDTLKAYIACNIELDRAMEVLLQKLSAAGVAEKTVIVITPDHYPYGLEDKEAQNKYHYFDEAAGHTIDTTFELYKSTLIIYNPGMQPVQVDQYCSSIDIIPTLNNLFGFSYDSRLLPGQDIFSGRAPLVMFLDGSFITDRGRYNAATGIFTPAAGQTVSEEYVEQMKKTVSNKFKISARILECDYYALVTGRTHLYSKGQ